MRRTAALAVIAVAGWILGGAAPPAAVSADDVSPHSPFLSVEIAPGPHTIGDRVEAVVTLSARAAELQGDPRFPDWGDAWGEAEVVSAGAVERGEEGDRALFRQRLELAAFRPGEVPLPPVVVTVPAAGGEVALGTPQGLALTIDSVLPPAGESTPEPEPMPPAPPRPLPLGARFWWTLAAAVGACEIVLLWALLRRRRTAAAAVREAPPFEELRAALDAARREDSPAAGHAAVSLAFRRWLGRVLRFPAAESSTAEIRRELSGRRLPDGAARRAASLLTGCDLIKFARREANAGQLAERADAALGLAAEIDAYLRPAPVEEAGDAGPESAREAA